MGFDLENVCRVALALIFLGAAGIGIPHRLRADRAGGPVSPRADPRWFWILMGIAGPPLTLACLAFLIQPRWVAGTQLEMPPWIRLAGIPLAVAGLALFQWMFVHLGLNVTSTSLPRAGATLVTSGPYRWVRHPMYSAVIVLVAAAALLTANLVVAIGGATVFALLAARSGIEEQRLIDKFGGAYRAYQQRTGRFIPNFPT